jgi:uncharacterized protein (DUF2141 family)
MHMLMPGTYSSFAKLRLGNLLTVPATWQYSRPTGIISGNQNQMIKLKNLFLLVFVLIVTPLALFGQFSLTIEINGLQNNDGRVLLEFSNEKEEKIMGFSQKIADSKCAVVIKNLTPGKYAFKYFHDENNNDKIDVNWLGIPKEGYGFSNNVKGNFGPPSFEKMIFVIKGDTALTCTPKYIKF